MCRQTMLNISDEFIEIMDELNRKLDLITDDNHFLSLHLTILHHFIMANIIHADLTITQVNRNIERFHEMIEDVMDLLDLYENVDVFVI